MFVRDKMNSEVITIAPDQNLRMARERMHKHRVRRLPVVEHGKLVGIVTDRDVRQAWASPATSLSVHELLYLLDHVTVAEVMTWKTFTVTADTPLVEAARLLHDHKIGGLPVVEGSAVVGMITETDQEVLAAIGRSQGHTEAMTMVAIIPNPLDPKAS
jgi:acetoin utilization protein AcuB